MALAVGALGLGSCAGAPEEPPLEISVRWGLTGTSALPSDVTEIEIIQCVARNDGEECTAPNTCTIEALTLMRAEGAVAGCRPAEGTEMFGDAPVLIREVPPEQLDAPIRFRLRARVTDGSFGYVGTTGPIVLGQGERRFVDLFMYEVGQVQPLIGSDVPRILHTATYLPDGRVLIAGGFESATVMAACPPELSLRAEARCWSLTATDEAMAFDVSTRTVEAIRSPMLAARGGHTATALPDGRVLIAGGAPRAILAMIPQGDPPDGTYEIQMFPQLADGTDGAHASFEVFDAFLDPEAEDVDRDGDLGRGRFFGAGGTNAPGALNHPRFWHAAAELPSQPGIVLLAGGMGGADSAASYEVFDANKPGGFGVVRGADNRLATARWAPTAVGIGPQVWIFGGLHAASNDELAEVWTPGDTDPNGSTIPATMLGAFPNMAAGETTTQPQYSLIKPSAAAIDMGQRALVVGWYGPLCEVGSDVPIYPAGETTRLCNSPPPPTTRSFTVTAGSGLTVPTQVRLHAFGAVGETWDFERTPESRRVAVTGGIANASWSANAAIDVFGDAVDVSGSAQTDGRVSVSLLSQRLFHTTTGVPGHGLVTVGGMSFNLGVDAIVLESEIETVFLAP